jgi:hypothetical protein
LRTIASIVLAFLMIAGFQRETQAQPVTKLYAVIFGVTVSSAGKIESLEVAKVIDPGTHSTEAVAVPVPAEYIASAKAYLSARTYPTNPSHFGTWLFFDPSRPTKADIDPKSGRP